MKYEVLPLPAPTRPTPSEIRALKHAIVENPTQWVRIKLEEGDVLIVDDVRTWRFGPSGEKGVEVRYDEGSLTPRWIDVRIEQDNERERTRAMYDPDGGMLTQLPDES